MTPLHLAARHGRLVLIAGLVAGLALPGLAQILRPWLPHLVVALLFVSTLRMAPAEVLGGLREMPRTALRALLLQLALPLGLIAVTLPLGLTGAPLVTALILMSAAPSIVGSPNIALMLGARPGPAMRLMVAGTALMPLTVLPVFWLAPQFGDAAAVLSAAGRLLVTVALTTAAAMALRHLALRAPAPGTLTALEGLSAIALAVFVIGLMPAVAAAASAAPLTLLGWLAAACGANWGLQILTRRLTRHQPHDRAVALSLISGNRNVALFLVSLPPEVTAPLMVFIGCYQIPMYLTPMVMGRLYAPRPRQTDAPREVSPPRV